MGLPFNIYLYSPTVLAQPLYSGQKLSSANNIGTWGQIFQINALSTFAVDDVIFYDPANMPIIYSSDATQNYALVDEAKILFKEI